MPNQNLSQNEVLANQAADLAAIPFLAEQSSHLSTLERVVRYVAIQHAGDLVSARRESLREVVIADVERFGAPSDKGGHRLNVGGHAVIRERRVSSAPDEKRLLALLKRKGLHVGMGFDTVTVQQPSPSKIDALVNLGHITQAEASALYKESFALVVHPSESLEVLLEENAPIPEKPGKGGK